MESKRSTGGRGEEGEMDATGEGRLAGARARRTAEAWRAAGGHWHDASDPSWFPYATEQDAQDAAQADNREGAHVERCTDASCLDGWSDDGDADVTEWAGSDAVRCGECGFVSRNLGHVRCPTEDAVLGEVRLTDAEFTAARRDWERKGGALQ